MKKQDVEIINVEIENLKESIIWWTNRFNAVERDKRELKKEIERLNNKLKETSQTLSEQTTKAITLKSENKRLNNIINELEHYLKLEKWKSVGGIHLGVINGVLDKLQELKGSDKVE